MRLLLKEMLTVLVIGVLIFVALGVAFSGPTPRLLEVRQKVHIMQTSVVLINGMFVPVVSSQHFLVSAENTRCRVSIDYYTKVKVGDKVTCLWLYNSPSP